MAELVEDLLFDRSFARNRLWLQRQVLPDGNFASVEKLFHHAHEFNKLAANHIEPGSPIGSCEHLGVAVEELSHFFDGIEGEREVVLLDEDVEDIFFIDAEDAAEVGLKGERALDFESAACVGTRLRYVSKMCSYMRLE